MRDIFAMGARPIALLDSLRFGPLRAPDGVDTPQHARNRTLFRASSRASAATATASACRPSAVRSRSRRRTTATRSSTRCASGSPKTGELLSAVATGVGNPIILVGADTGRDGIGGANVLASRTFEEGSEELRPTVQVGNPFLEKLLMEACVELAEQHADWIVGLQDLGAAGLTSSLVECAARGGEGIGIDIDVALVPRREQGMTAYEVMLSESQERMLIVAKKEHEADVLGLFRRWEIHSDVIGHVTDDPYVRIRDGDETVVRVPAEVFTEPPEYRRTGIKPDGLDALQTYDLASLPDLAPADANDVLMKLLASPEIASKRWIYRQYDHQVLTNTTVGPGSDAAVLRIKEAAPRAIAVATDGSGLKTYLDPFAGGALAIAEACRNVACTGARPLAVTDCMNYGNPERLDVYYQLEESVRGMVAACESLGVPVISGNVSLFNESHGTAIYPTPIIGALGLLEDVSKAVPMGFAVENDAVYLIGADSAHAAPERPRRQRVPAPGARPHRRHPQHRPRARGQRATIPHRRGWQSAPALGARLLARWPRGHAGRVVLPERPRIHVRQRPRLQRTHGCCAVRRSSLARRYLVRPRRRVRSRGAPHAAQRPVRAPRHRHRRPSAPRPHRRAAYRPARELRHRPRVRAGRLAPSQARHARNS